ncbi:MAG: sigma-54-dependent Fis family transcriptional regulator [Polyangiaceae bacterium]|nr:sigma-54-dependent Fis family transcriptional regulator [Polyangiaceae bacterium]
MSAIRVVAVGTSPEVAQSLDAHDVTSLERDDHLASGIEQLDPEVLVIDLGALGDPGLQTLRAARRRCPGAGFIALLADGAQPRAALEAGADVFVDSANAIECLDFMVSRAFDKVRATRRAARLERVAQETLSLASFERILGNHPLMQQLLTKVAHVAPTRSTVLIHGESGTGKELIASALHFNSRRREGPFVRLNCAALADSVLESELFGHEKGAFTGAIARREGRFKQADNGTLFLDEVSEIPMPLQVKLLRFLQEREFERVGGNETLKVDVRIVGATNRDLKALVSDGKFREDLYYRLNVVRLDVPPLRARPSDILLLAEHFLRRFAEENERHVAAFDEAARRVLVDYPWPGNVRELENAIEQAVVLAEGDTLSATDLPLSLPNTQDNALKLMIPGVTMAEIERYAILQTLKAVDGSTSRAARVLDISRRTIQYRLKEWGIEDKAGGYESSPSELVED